MLPELWSITKLLDVLPAKVKAPLVPRLLSFCMVNVPLVVLISNLASSLDSEPVDSIRTTASSEFLIFSCVSGVPPIPTLPPIFAVPARYKSLNLLPELPKSMF